MVKQKNLSFGLMNVLELVRRTGARVLQASTSEIYEDPLVHLQAEDYLAFLLNKDLCRLYYISKVCIIKEEKRRKGDA